MHLKFTKKSDLRNKAKESTHQAYKLRHAYILACSKKPPLSLSAWIKKIKKIPACSRRHLHLTLRRNFNIRVLHFEALTRRKVREGRGAGEKKALHSLCICRFLQIFAQRFNLMLRGGAQTRELARGRN